eukprot:TRINITY_DN4282_c1_g1_i1.p2 TRINITY_DN4282_c1_g1~~TRINITY_DN4282_c1_g1_i1.p2  ORF type:complete len:205 (+),score=51.97 TRINITY_DN4282_c1_g1_i1:73-687(+)
MKAIVCLLVFCAVASAAKWTRRTTYLTGCSDSDIVSQTAFEIDDTFTCTEVSCDATVLRLYKHECFDSGDYKLSSDADWGTATNIYNHDCSDKVGKTAAPKVDVGSIGSIASRGCNPFDECCDFGLGSHTEYCSGDNTVDQVCTDSDCQTGCVKTTYDACNSYSIADDATIPSSHNDYASYTPCNGAATATAALALIAAVAALL